MLATEKSILMQRKKANSKKSRGNKKSTSQVTLKIRVSLTIKSAKTHSTTQQCEINPLSHASTSSSTLTSSGAKKITTNFNSHPLTLARNENTLYLNLAHGTMKRCDLKKTDINSSILVADSEDPFLDDSKNN